MDILERIVEAVAQKLISLRLEEANLTIGQAKAGIANARAKRLGREAGAGKKFGHTGQAKEVKPLSSKEAGATGNQRKRFSDGGDLSSGTKEDPFNRAARSTPIKPELSTTKGPGGGKESKRGVES